MEKIKVLTPEEEFYGDYYEKLLESEGIITNLIEKCRREYILKHDRDPIEHSKTRIKSFESMKKKLYTKNYPIDVEYAINHLHDAIGARVICTFIKDIYMVAEWLQNQEGITVVEFKDYIANAKPNGYRSLHLIISIAQESIKDITIEVQIRTIAMDCWAALEHQMKYKKNIKNQEIIVRELKRCADEIASTDISLQTLKDLISEE